MDRHRPLGHAFHIGCKRQPLLAFDHLRIGSQVAGQYAGVLRRHATGELDGGVGGNGFMELGIELAQILVRQHHADAVLACL